MQLSGSIDGGLCDNITRKGNDAALTQEKNSEAFSDCFFSFWQRHGFLFHPMVSAENVKHWTLELFEAIAGQRLDQERRQMVFGWLSALLKMPWLDDSEKHNALILLDYLESAEGGEVFAPLYRAARARLAFERPPAWEMDWPENYQVVVNGENLTPEDLRRRGIPNVDFRLTKPIRGSMEYTLTRRLHSDGRVELLHEYQAFPAPPVGERHLFHVYGEKAVSR